MEAALLLPAFLALIFGIIEGALLMNSNLAIADTTANAARSAAVFGRNADADFQIVQAVKESLRSSLVGDPIKLVIWKADGLDDTIPPACLSGHGTDAADCNVYYPTDEAWESDDPTDEIWICGDPQSVVDNWCPSERQESLLPAPGPDWVGIHVELDHDMVTGIIGQDIHLIRNSIARIEPKAVN